MTRFQRLLASASAAVGVIPGFTVMAVGLGAPAGRQVLFGGVMEAIGALTLLTAWANRARIQKWSLNKTNKTIKILGAAAVSALVLYLIAFQAYVFELPGRAQVIYPLVPRGAVAEAIATAGGRAAAITYNGAGEMNAMIFAHPIGVALTIVTLLLLFQAIFTCLTAAFAVAAIRK